MRLLFAEDHPELRNLISAILQKGGHTVECFSNGRELIERIDCGPTDFGAVITDNSMPYATGVEVLRHIRRKAELNHLSVVICSTYDLPAFKASVEKEGGTYVYKASGAQDLLRQLNAAITSEGARSF